MLGPSISQPATEFSHCHLFKKTIYLNKPSISVSGLYDYATAENVRWRAASWEQELRRVRRNDCPTMVDSEPVTAQSLYTGETVLWGDGDEAVPVTVEHADAESGLVSVRHCYPLGDQGK